MNNYLSIITLNVNGLNAPIKRHRMAEWIRKHDPHICCLQQSHLRTKDLHKLKGLETNFPSKRTGKKAGVAILITDKIHFKKRAIETDPEGHNIILKGGIHQEDKHCKYICTQHRSTQIHEENLGGLQERY